MLEALRLVRGAVSTKDLMPVLTHFAIHDGRIQGFNGRLAISAPVPELSALSLTVPALGFVRAIDACGEHEPAFEHVDNKLIIRAGEFKATLPTGPIDAWPGDLPSTQAPVPYRGALLPCFTALAPFIGEDASRPWAAGVSLSDRAAAATNNIIIAIYALTKAWPGDHIIPIQGITELIRIGLEPFMLGIEQNTLTFHFKGNVWLRTALVDGVWPRSPGEMIAQIAQEAKWAPIPEAIGQAVEQIAPFSPDAKNPLIRFEDGMIKTPDGISQAEVCGFKDLGRCTFRVEPLKVMLKAATHADWSLFPRVPWKGERLTGAIVGLTV